MSQALYAQVIVPLPLPPLTYKVPEGLALTPGQAVAVRVRKKYLEGIVTELRNAPPPQAKFEVRELEGISDKYPALGEESRKMLLWAADYYHYPAGEVLRAFLPPNPTPPQAIRFRLSEDGRRRLDAGERLVRDDQH